MQLGLHRIYITENCIGIGEKWSDFLKEATLRRRKRSEGRVTHHGVNSLPFQSVPIVPFHSVHFSQPILESSCCSSLSAHSSNQKRSSSLWGTLWRSRARWDIQSLQQVLGLRQHLSFKEGQPGGTQIRQSDHIHGLLWNQQRAAALLQSTSRCLSISSSNSDRL